MNQAAQPAQVQRTNKETNLRIELNRIQQQLENWAKQLSKINNDVTQNISKGMMGYSQNLKKVVDAN